MVETKMAGHVAYILFFLFMTLFSVVLSDGGRHSRFEYKLSFKGPHLTNKQGNVPFWTHYGSKSFSSAHDPYVTKENKSVIRTKKLLYYFIIRVDFSFL